MSIQRNRNGVGLWAPLITQMLLWWAPTAMAGWLAGAGGSAVVFSLRPVDFESTPNYYGLGPTAYAGYSFKQTVDLLGIVSYTPGHTGRAIIGKEQALLLSYGGQVGVRIEEQAYIALFAGTTDYRLVQATADAVKGYWQGSSGGIRIGSLFKLDKERYWQVSLHYMFAALALKSDHELDVKERDLDGIGFTMSYTFNGFVSGSRRRSVFGIF